MNFICPICGLPMKVNEATTDEDAFSFFVHRHNGLNIWMDHGDDLEDRHSFVNELLDCLSCNILAFEGGEPINNFGDTQ